MATFEDSDFDVVGVSWTTSPAEAWRSKPCVKMCKFTFCLVSCPSASDASLGETKTLYADVCSRVSSQVRKMGKRAMRAVLTSEFYCCQARRTCPSKCCRACLHAYTHGSTGWDSFFHGVTCSGTFEHSLCMLPNTINFPADRCLQFYIEAAVCIQSCLIQWFYSCLTEATFGYSLQQPLSCEVAYSCQAVCLLCFSEIHFGKKKQTTWKELQMKKGMHCLHSPAHRTCMLYVYVCVILRNKSTLYRYMQCHNRHVPVYIEDTTRSSQWQRWKERKKRLHGQTVKPLLNLWHCWNTLEHWYSDDRTLQGNLDPHLSRTQTDTDTGQILQFPSISHDGFLHRTPRLYADTEQIRERTVAMVKEFGLILRGPHFIQL